jgi:hypothetical protein
VNTANWINAFTGDIIDSIITMNIPRPSKLM